jgi:hypothetical protein
MGKPPNVMAEAIRQAIEVYGYAVGKKTTIAIRNWIRENYPDLDVESESFSANLHHQRKKVEKAGGRTVFRDRRRRKARRGVPLSGADTVPALPDSVDAVVGAEVLLELQRLAARVGVETVKKLAAML